MTIDQTLPVMSPIIQYGFAGFAFALLAVLVWFVSKLLDVLKETNKVIGDNSKAVESVAQVSRETIDEVRELKLQLASRPCQAGK